MVTQTLCRALGFSSKQNKYLPSTYCSGLNRVPSEIPVYSEPRNVALFRKRSLQKCLLR